jgi:hypothetical protein
MRAHGNARSELPLHPRAARDGQDGTGARLIFNLIRCPGESGTSHKAMHNLLDEAEEAAKAEGVHFRGLKTVANNNDESSYESAHITSATDTPATIAAVGPRRPRRNRTPPIRPEAW